MKTALFVLVALMVGCAHRPCQPARIVMADRGEVLSCYKKKMRDSVDIADVCMIRQKDGVVREKIVTRYHCEQRDN